ncbi:MAG: YggS family pyridoxal phosphate enzyme [Thiomonas sp. 20-64-5]|nr:MAG: YggS family pyridoxal phosphate enzyme [Thiomonas sp. 20-64-5]
MPLNQPLEAVRRRIAFAARNAHRDPQTITLLAVSKTFPAQNVAQLAALGQIAFGENYVQEAVDKITALRPDWPELQWHFIGPLQSNKTRDVATQFDWVHSIDRLKLAQRLSAQRSPGLPPLQVCIQVNVDGEATKSGVAPEDAGAMAAAVAALPNLRLRGLMCIPPADDEPTLHFALLREIARDHSVVVVEHDMSFVRDLGVKVTVLHEGAVLAEGALDEVSADPRVIEVYLGR